MEPSRIEANRLYWQTDASVAVIAEQLGLSRRALYDLLEAAPADPACPECGGALTFANRLARSTGDAYCAACAVNRAVTGVVRRAARAGALSEAGEGAEARPGADGGEAGPVPAAGNGAGVAARRGAGRGRTGAPLLPPRPPEPLARRLLPADFALAIGLGLAVGTLAALLFSRRAR